MNTLPYRFQAALLLACLALLTGCGRDEAAPAPATSAASPYVAIARGSIGIEGGLLPLASTVDGVVDRVHVHVGDNVRKGQVLATLRDGSARAAVAIARGHLAQARAGENIVAMQLDAARKQAKTLAEAAAAGADSGQHATEAANRAAVLQARKASASAAVTVARGELDQAESALARHALRAPAPGQVTQVNVQPGESVSRQGGPLFVLLPDRPRIVLAEVNSDFVTGIHKGMQANVVLDNAAETPVGMAKVSYVGEVFGPSTLEEDPSVRANVRTVKCRLQFDKPLKLRIGQRVLVRFLRATPARH